jgi:hypothetical protein
MTVQVPPAVLSKPPGSLVPILSRGEVVLFVRETEWNVKRYPPACPVDLRVGHWEIDSVLLVALVLRLARSDAATFDCPMDVQTPLGIRVLQGLAAQPQVDVHVVADQAVRRFRATNPAPEEAAYLVDSVRSREPWSAEDAERALARLNQLYPTARDLWRNCTQRAKEP